MGKDKTQINSTTNETSVQAERELEKIYQQEKVQDFNTLRKQAATQRLWLWFTTSLLFLVVAGGLWFFFFRNTNEKFGEEAVSVKLSGPESSPSGQTIDYTLTWFNNQKVGLDQVEVNFRFPTGFTLTSSSVPTVNQDKNKFLVGNIKGEAKGELKITGQLVGEVGEKKDIAAVFSYQPDNFQSSFNKTLFTQTELVASVVTLELQAPTQVPIEQDMVLVVNYTNNSTDELSSLAIRLNPPSGFELEQPKLEAATGENNIWKLPILKSKGKGRIEFKGKFNSGVGSGDREFAVGVGVLGENNQFALQEEKKIITTIIESSLTLSLTANQVSLKSYADWGEQMDFTLQYANEGETVLANTTFNVKINSQFLDLSTWQADVTADINTSNGSILWTKKELPLLSRLDPGEKGTINFRLKVISVPPLIGSAPYSFTTSVLAKADQQIGSGSQLMETESNVITTKINTQIGLQTEGRYYTDQLVKIGSGPLPPRVDSTTTYVIFWKLSNTLNDANNIEVTTTLPQDVTWTGQATVSAGQNVVYNPNTREVRWELNRLPAGAGFKFASPEASFEVGITPGASDADKILVLTKASTLTAKDDFSGADLISTDKVVTTDLDNDLGAQGKGVVVR